MKSVKNLLKAYYSYFYFNFYFWNREVRVIRAANNPLPTYSI